MASARPAVGFDLDGDTFAGGKHHDTHDALGIDAATVAFEIDLTLKRVAVCGELGRGPLRATPACW